MMRALPIRLLTLVASMTVLLACQPEQPAGDSAAQPATRDAAGDGGKPLPGPASGGKPSAPITIRYRVLGNAFVGQTIAIEVALDSSITDRPIELSYHVNDAGSLQFPETQARSVSVRIDPDEGSATRQVTVVPQREGRLYLNVLAEVAVENGKLVKSIAIPVSVGRGSLDKAPAGELKTDAAGDTVESMPADEH